MTWEVYVSTPPVGKSGSPSTVNESNCNKKNTSKKILWAHFQFHSDLSQQDVLEEGCHLLYCSGEMGSSTCSPDSRCRRFLIDSSSNIRSKSHKPIFAWLVQNEIPFSLVSSIFLLWEMIRMVFFCKFVHLFSLLFCPSDCELWFTINWIYEKSIVNTCKMSTFRVNFPAASPPRIPGQVILSLYFGLAMSSTMSGSFLYHVVWDRECIQCQCVKFSSGFAVNQALSASAIHNSLIQIKKTVRTLYFWCSFAQLE